MSNFRITANIDFLGIVRSTCKRRININQINLNPTILKERASRNTLAANHKVPITIHANLLYLIHFIEGHPAFNSLYYLIVITISKNTLCSNKIIKKSLAF